MESAKRALRLIRYPSFRAQRRPRLLPINLTVSVIYSCPSRCLTCDIWKKTADNLTLDEYDRVFHSLERAPAWVTVSGGDQFLRKDLPDIFRLVREILRPSVINLPINGVLTKRIEEMLPLIAQHTRGSQLVLNFSIDDIGERHDRLRGHRNNYDKVVASYRLAKRLQREHDHLVVGIHTVISKFNADRIGTIADRLEELEPDSYITEIAEQRVELGTEDKDIAPDQQAYGRAVDALAERMRRRRRRGRPIGRLVESLRLEYYELVKRILAERTQVIPCYAGWASAHLAPDGDVWGCCVRAEPLGNVRDADYDFRKVWFSDAADAFRSSVRAKECACPLANASYTNMLLSPRSLLGVARNYLSA